MRQDNVKEEARYNDQRSPNKRTFGDAKQGLPEYDDKNQKNTYSENMYNSDNAFMEADEDESCEGHQPYQTNYYGASEPKLPFEEEEYPGHPIRHSVENYMTTEPHYSSPEESSWYGRKERPHRRRSREFAENEVMLPNEDEHRRKPETMRSISEDTPTRTAKQLVTRRTLSHPEKDSHSQVASTITVYNNSHRRNVPFSPETFPIKWIIVLSLLFFTSFVFVCINHFYSTESKT